MIPQISRLPQEEFKVRGYRTVPTPFFLLKTKKNALEKPRIGIVIGKAIYKEAVKRNFWKRQAKTAFLKNLSGSTDLLIIFVSNKSKLTKKRFQEDFAAAINKFK